jgi:hypothetical protein
MRQNGRVRRALLLLALPLAPLVLPLAPLRGDDAELPDVDGAAILEHVKWLADDDRQGRAAGSPGERAAGDYVAGHFQRLGLKPVGDQGTFFQGFTLPQGFDISQETSLAAERDGKKVELSYDKDLKPLSLSGPGDVTAEAAFLGYGIAAPELGYDDYEGMDVKGKVVLVLRHAPGFKDPKSPFAPPAVQRRYGTFEAKVATAVGAGAAALVVVNDFKQASKPKEDVAMHAVGGNPSSIPVFHVTYKAGRRLDNVLGLDLRKEQNEIDREGKPRSRLLPGVRVRVNAALRAKLLDVRNVCGLLEAAGRPVTQGGDAPAAPPASPPAGPPRETLVVGAHFDHVGLGAYGSLAGSKGEGSIHNGADDNASGTSSLLEIAGWLAARRHLLKRDVLFLCFTAEELGLLGSKHYVEKPLLPLEQCVAMVNLDMVGRLDRGRLQVGGTGTSPVFPDLLEDLLRRHRVAKYRFNPGGRAPSDNTSFYEKGMPVLFFFTGLHEDYHRPSDDWKTIDRKGIERVARVAADTCLDLATRETRPPFTRSEASGLAAGPELGLSLEQRADGVYVIFVEEKSPASKARFEVGDKVEEFEGQPVKSITNFNQVHMATKPGQKVKITVRRGARLLEKTVTLGEE